MPLSSPTFTAACWTQALTYLPTAGAAIRVNAAMGISPHNPTQVLVTRAAQAWLAGIMVPSTVPGTYNGVMGAAGTQAAPAPFTIPGGPGAAAAFQSSMAWAGPAGTSMANALTTGIFATTMSQGMIQFAPVPGGATGAITVLPMSHLTPAIFLAELMHYFSAPPAVFTNMDSGAGLTAHIARLASNLSVAFSTAALSITAPPISVVGAPVPPPPTGPSASPPIPWQGSIV